MDENGRKRLSFLKVQGEEEGTTSGGLFGGLFGGRQTASLATVAEKNLGGADVLSCTQCPLSTPSHFLNVWKN
jgi:hypothetical protein